MSDEVSIKSSNEENWRNHVLAAQNFTGSDQEYCRRHHLNPSTFSVYKQKLGLTRSQKREPAQVAGQKSFVQVSTPTQDKSVSRQRSSNAKPLPDPKWTAEFLRAWMNAEATDHS